MKCFICKQGETHSGTATVTLTREQLTLVVKGVPAQVCTSCGEEYVASDITSQLLKAAEDAASSGVQRWTYESTRQHKAVKGNDEIADFQFCVDELIRIVDEKNSSPVPLITGGTYAPDTPWREL